MGLVSILKIELHPWCQQKPIVEYCRSKGIIIQAYCPLVRAQYFSDPTLTKIAEKVRQVLFFFLIATFMKLKNGILSVRYRLKRLKPKS